MVTDNVKDELQKMQQKIPTVEPQKKEVELLVKLEQAYNDEEQFWKLK